MQRIFSAGVAALPAAAAAGPLFVTMLAAITLYARLPQPIVISGGELVGFLFILPLSTIFGFLLAYPPNFACAKLMAAIAENSELAREPVVWALAGGGIVAAVIVCLDGRIDGAVQLSMILTGAACGRICRSCYGGPEKAQA